MRLVNEDHEYNKKKFPDIFKDVDQDLRDLAKELRKKGCIVMSNTSPSEPISKIYVHKDDKSVMVCFNKNYLFSVHGDSESETYVRHMGDVKWRLPKRVKDGRYIIRFLLDHGVEEDKSMFLKSLGPYKKVVESIDLKEYLQNRIIQN